MLSCDISVWYLEDARHHRVMPPRPHLFDDVSVGLGDLALHTQRVGEVQLLQVGALQEVLGQRSRVTETLQRDEETGRVKKETRVLMLRGFRCCEADKHCDTPDLIPDNTLNEGFK